MIPLFHPENRYWEECSKAVEGVLKTRWWGQANKVDEFEKSFSNEYSYQYCLALNSGSAALELAYHLIGIAEGDEIITPILTCSATNIPLLRMKAKIVFADIKKDTLIIDYEDVEKKITKKTKAIVAVTLGGLPIDKKLFQIANKNNIPVVIDAAQSLGVSEQYGDFITYSFQAIKHYSTGDGGMLVIRNIDDYKRGKQLRWFGINRESQTNADGKKWKNRKMTIDVKEPGYKFHMNDISAAIGLTMLKYSDEILEYRKELASIYNKKLIGCDTVSGGSYWLYGILIENRDKVGHDLLSKGIEVNMVHIRNDIYSAFGGERENLVNMNFVEERYLYLPLNTFITEKQVKKVIEEFNSLIDIYKK